MTLEEARNEAFIDFLHHDHEWVPGSAAIVKEAFEAGWLAALKAAAKLTRKAE